MIDASTLRAAWWAFWAASRARHQLRSGGLEALQLDPAPAMPASAERGVNAMLYRRGETCLVRAAVRRAWFEGQGIRRDLIVGVKAPGGDFAAHAWLEGDPPQAGAGFVEIVRR